jgi:hypothetical protein
MPCLSPVVPHHLRVAATSVDSPPPLLPLFMLPPPLMLRRAATATNSGGSSTPLQGRAGGQGAGRDYGGEGSVGGGCNRINPRAWEKNRGKSENGWLWPTESGLGGASLRSEAVDRWSCFYFLHYENLSIAVNCGLVAKWDPMSAREDQKMIV